MKKKLISAMIYIYIAVVVGVVASAETITGLGVSFPIMKLLKADNITAECSGNSNHYAINETWVDGGIDFEDTKITGVQGSIKVRHIFDSRFVLGADFDIGRAQLKINGDSSGLAKYTGLNLDLTIGYAIVDADRFTLILSAVAGLQHAKANLGTGYLYKTVSHENVNTEDATERYTAFEFGGELFMNFRIGDCFGIFASCKLLGDVGNLRDKYPSYYSGDCSPKETFHKTTAFVVKPSVGVSFTF